MTVQTHRFFKTAALMLALILSANIILPLQGNIFATTVYASSSVSMTDGGGSSSGSGGDEEPKGEGQEQLQESNEYWLEKNIDTSFPYQIRMATNYANRVIGAGKNIGDPIGTEGESYTENLKMSNIAPFLGFTPGEVEDHILHRQESQRSARDSISATKYSRQLIYAEGGHGKTKAKGAAQYYKYGLTLSLMGFDSVGTEDVDNRRKTIGLVSMVAYYAASSVNVIFDQMFKILIDTNPFQFFKAATMEVGSDVLGGINYSEQSEGAMQALAEFIGPIYDLFVNFSWAVTVPIALVFVIVAFFITRNTSNAVTGFKKFMIRVVFLVMGIPILACAYTDVLTKLSEMNYYADDFAVEMISRTFCDFRSWVEQNRLGIPDGADVNIRSIGSESKDTVLGGTTILELRETCLQLNKANKTFDLGTDLVMETDADSGVVLKKLDKLVINNTTKPDKFDGTANRTKVMSVLGDYFYGVKYTASEFQTGTDGYLEAENVKYGDLFALSSDPYSFSPDSTIKVTGMMNNNKYYTRNDYEGTEAWKVVAKDRFNGGFTDYGIGAKIWNNGYDSDVTSFESFKGCSAAGGASETGGTGDDISGKEKAGLNPGNDGGFSTMAMYTYLTTEFDQSGMTVYNGAPSQYTQKEHYAINLIGCNYVMQFLFFLNTVTLLLGYFVLALAYGFKTIFDILFKGIQLIGHAILAAAGFYKSIGTTICMTVNMLAQLFVCVIFYSFMIDLLFTMITVSNNFFVDIAKNVLGITNTTGNSFHAEIMVILGTLFSIFVTVFFVSFAVKWRAAIMNAVNQNTEAVVGTLLGVNLQGASEGGVMGGMARSAFNDAVNITKMGVAAAGVDSLAASTQDIVNDYNDSKADGDIKEVRGSVSAADSAVNPEAGSTLSGVGGSDNEATSAEDKAEADEVLANGVNPDELRDKGIDPDKLQTGGWYHGGADGPDYRIHDAKEDGTPEEYYAKQAEEERKKNLGASDSMDNDTQENAKKAEEAAQSGAYEEDAVGNKVMLRKDSAYMDAQDKARNAQAAADSGAYDKAEVESSNAASASNNEEEEGKLEKAPGGDRGDSTQENEDHSVDISTNGGGVGRILNKPSKGDSITSEAVEDKNGETTWEQTNSELGTKSKISQGEDGVHIQTDNENGTASDVVVGSEGTDIKAIDGAGNKSEVTVDGNNMDAVYEGVDGSGEKVHAELEGDNAGTVIDKNSPDGASEHIESGKNGEVVNYSGVSADGKIKNIDTNPDTGVKTITESDPTTGYESVESIAADGSSVKNESVNGIKTMTQKDAAGNITSVHTEGTDENGKAFVSDTSYNADGSSVETLTSGNSTFMTEIDSAGNVTKTSTVTNADGSTMSTITELGTDNVPDKITEIAADAQGNEIQRTVRSSGSDSMGAYTGTTTTTAAGTLETKDYGGGHIVTTETTGNNQIVSETTDGGLNTNITATDLSTGTMTKSSVNAVAGSGSSVTYDSNGAEIANTAFTTSEDGTRTVVANNLATGDRTVSHINMATNAGDSTTFDSSGAAVASETFTTAGDGSRTVTTKTGGMTTVTDYDTSGGYVATSLDSSTGEKTVTSVGSGSAETIRYGSGGNVLSSETITANGSGGFNVEAIDNISGTATHANIDAMGNGTSTVTRGGQVLRSAAVSGGNYATDAGTTFSMNNSGEMTAAAATMTGGSIAMNAASAATPSYTSGLNNTFEAADAGRAVAFGTGAGGTVAFTTDDVGRAAVAVGAGMGAGSLAVNALRNGSAVETSAVYTSASGAQSSYGANSSTGSYQTAFVDAMGGQYSTGYNGNTGDSTAAFTTVGGSSGSMVNANNGSDFSSRVSYGGNGGYDNVIRTGSGSTATETVTSADMVGNSYRAASVGGELREIHIGGVDGSSYDQAVANGVVTTSQVAMSGARSVMTDSGNNNYTVENTGFMGDASTLTSSNNGNNMTYTSSSITGIDTTAMRNGSATSTTVQTDSVKIMSSMDEATGAAYNSFANVMSGQTVTNGINAEGGRQTQIDFADGNYGSFTQNADGQSVVTISRGSNGAGLTGIGPMDNIQYVYQDSNGQVVDVPSMNDAATIPIAQGVMGYAINAQNGVSAPYMQNGNVDMSGTGMIMPNVETGESTGLGSISIGAAGAAGMAGGAVSGISSSIKKLFRKKVEITEEEEEDEITATTSSESSKPKAKRKALSTPAGAGRSLRRTSGSFGRDKYRDGGSSSNNNSDRA